jgi:predicted porin
MKKLVIAAAVLGAFAGTAQAQSSVTLFGVVDVNVTHLSNNGGTNKTFMDNNGINSSRLGFRGTEDLGGGLKAGFWLEAGISPNTGAAAATSSNNQATGGYTGTGALNGAQGLTFNRRSTVSLISDVAGELRIGRDYSPTFWNAANTDPFGYNGLPNDGTLLAIAPAGLSVSTNVRISNALSYLTPNTLGGFFAQISYALSNNPSDYFSTSPTGATGALPYGAPCPVGATCYDIHEYGRYIGGNVGYQNGPIYVGLAAAQFNQATSAATGNVKTYNFGASYDFGIVKPDFFYQTEKSENLTTTPRLDIYQLGASAPFGQSVVNLTFARAEGKNVYEGSSANVFGIGYVYNLSKRSALYAQYSRVNNKGEFAFPLNDYTNFAPAAGHDQSGVAIGVRHSF